MIKKILIGGQGGVDRAARDVAVKFEIPWVGPAAPHADSDRNPLRSGAAALTVAMDGRVRHLKKNVLDADGTLMISDGSISNHQKRCRSQAEKHHRPWLHIDLKLHPAFKTVRLISEWVLQNSVEVLHVAGAETDNSPVIYEKAFHILSSVYWLAQARAAAPGAARTDTAGGVPAPEPATVAEAVDRLEEQMTLKDRTTLANMTAKELAALDDSLGAYVRNHFGLATGNRRLLTACRVAAAGSDFKDSDAALLIVTKLWKKLKKTHKLRLVK